MWLYGGEGKDLKRKYVDWWALLFKNSTVCLCNHSFQGFNLHFLLSLVSQASFKHQPWLQQACGNISQYRAISNILKRSCLFSHASCLTSYSSKHSESGIHATAEGSGSLTEKAPSPCVINNKSHAGEKIKLITGPLFLYSGSSDTMAVFQGWLQSTWLGKCVWEWI